MSGYSKFYVVGGVGGYMGADGVNPIEFLILVGDADRQWLEPHYFDKSIKPLGRIQTIVPPGPNLPDNILDACIAFGPRYFRSCPSLSKDKSELKNVTSLDFDARPQEILTSWAGLREEARPLFKRMNIWRADLIPIERS